MSIENIATKGQLISVVTEIVNKAVRPLRAGASGTHPPRVEADVPVNTFFVDQADGVAKFKDSGGVVHDLY